MKKYTINSLKESDCLKLLKRPAIDFSSVVPVVRTIIEDVKKTGDRALIKYANKFDKVSLDGLKVSPSEIKKAATAIDSKTKAAFKQSYKNIYNFHKAQVRKGFSLQTQSGVDCGMLYRAIDSVGLYIPGGSAVLPSTVLMLAIPATIAGCENIQIVTPPGKDGKVSDFILYAASLCGVKNIYKAGGAQGIAALAYGTETIKKADKIFGPGNQYVTAAKMLVSVDPQGAQIDMPAGPTEVLIIADNQANPDFVAADLLAQAEHGADSQVVLVSLDPKLPAKVMRALNRQIKTLPRKKIAEKALKKSFILQVNNLKQALKFSNDYAPEHLILNVKNPRKILAGVKNAGSVFLGNLTPESAGDYASGTNHALPTYGYAKACSGVSLSSFQKHITYQEIKTQGISLLADAVSILARAEGLEAHARAMDIRRNK